MKSKILRVGIVTILIIAMTMVNFIFVGESLISYAVDNASVETSTNNNNVKFAAYFKDASGNVLETLEKGVSAKDTKMYLEVDVQNEGYFNGTISLENSNFNITNCNNEYVNKVENNVITLNQINAGTKAIIEVLIEPKLDETIELSLLNMESEIAINGIYKNSTQKDINIKSSRKVTLTIVNTDNSKENVKNNLEIITNKVIKVNGEDKRVIQLSLQTGLVNNTYPIKSINIDVNVPSINGKQPSIEKIINRNTMLSYNYNYSGSDNSLAIDMENIASADTQNRILWRKSGNEEVILTYIYDSDINIDETTITSTTNITLHNDEKIEANDATVTLKNDEEKNSVATVSILNSEKSISKGKLYSGIDRNFITNTIASVNMVNVEEFLKIEDANVLSDGTALKVKYNQTIINKEQLFKILGENGVLTITNLSGAVIASIDNSTQVDERGNIVIDYGTEGQDGIIITTTKPVNTGKVEITNNKTIKQNDVNKIKSANQIINSATMNVETEVINTSNAAVELTEPTTEAKLEVNRDSLSTATTNKNVKVTVTLKSNDEQYDLYKNPEIKIILPEDITDIKLNAIDKLYGEEFTESHSMEIKDGRRILTINLTGEQTSYKEVGIEGTTIILDFDLTLNNKAVNKISSFDMIYTNENANQYKDGKSQGEEISEISIVSPKGLITTNNILDLDIATIGEEKLVSKTIDRNAVAKQVAVESEIINNNDGKVTNVQILGDFGTDGKALVNNEEQENNIGLILKSNLNVEGIDTSKIKIYYTENSLATADLTNTENGWKESITDAGKTRKYLIAISNMEVSESIKVAYNMEIPSNLEYNQQSYSGYSVSYTDSTTGTQGNIDATTIKLETGKGAVVEADLSATLAGEKLNSGDEVLSGEVIKYSINVSNKGSEDSNNIKISVAIPEGTTLVEPLEDYVYAGNAYYEEKTDTTKEFTIDTLKAGETVTKEYEIRVKSDITDGKAIESTAKISYGETTKTTNSITNILKSGDIRLTTKRVVDESIPLYEGGSSRYYAIIENTSSEEKTNVKVNSKLTKNIIVNKLQLISTVDGKSKTENIDYGNEVNIGTLKPGEIKILRYAVKIDSSDLNKLAMSVSVTDNGKTYRSNETTDEIKKVSVSATMESDKGQYVKSGDEITYTIKVSNNTNYEANNLSIRDKIPSQMTVKEVTIDGVQQEVKDSQTVAASVNLKAGETTVFTIKAIVNYNANRTEPETMTNQAIVKQSETVIAQTEEITTIISANSNNGDGQDNNNEEGTYMISGVAWLDSNDNGEKDNDDTILKDIKVKLLNTETNEIQKNSSNKEITATTNDKGIYILNNIPEGKYIVIFEYDTYKYKLATYKKSGIAESKNSDVIAKEITLNQETKTYGATDEINIEAENIADINIGLVELKTFDLKLDKYVSKVIVQNSSGTTTYSYNDETLAKVELNGKKLAGTTVIIEYKIRVSNVGELEGYAKKIVDYLPSDLKFSSELNKDWYQQDKNIYNASLANEKIAAGETKEVTLTVTKAMTENNVGLVNNTAEIAESYNESAVADINSTPGNNTRGENDFGSADVIISVNTGLVITYISIIVIGIITLGAGTYFITKKVSAKKII